MSLRNASHLQWYIISIIKVLQWPGVNSYFMSMQTMQPHVKKLQCLCMLTCWTIIDNCTCLLWVAWLHLHPPFIAAPRAGKTTWNTKHSPHLNQALWTEPISAASWVTSLVVLVFTHPSYLLLRLALHQSSYDCPVSVVHQSHECLKQCIYQTDLGHSDFSSQVSDLHLV